LSRSLRGLTRESNYSEHAGDKFVDELLAVSPDTTSVERMSLLFETLEGGVELEGPEEVVGLLESGTNSPDFVDEVLDAVDTVGGELVSDDGVVGERDAGSVDLSISALVDKLSHVGTGGVAIGDVRLNNTEHVDSGLVKLDKHAVVELTESQELHDLLALGGELVDTSGSDNESNLGFSGNVDLSSSLGSAESVNSITVFLLVFSVVLLGVGSESFALVDTGLLGIGALFGEVSENLSITGSLLSEVFRNVFLIPKQATKVVVSQHTWLQKQHS